MTQDFIFAQDVILDPDTAKVLAVVRNGGVWRNGTRIAVLVGGQMYDLTAIRSASSLVDRGQIALPRARVSRIAMPRTNLEGPAHSLGIALLTRCRGGEITIALT